MFCAFSSKAALVLYSSLHFSIQHYKLSCCTPVDVLIIHSNEYSSSKTERKCMALIKCFSLTTTTSWTVPTIGCRIVKRGFTKHRVKLFFQYLPTVQTWECYFTLNLSFLSTKWEWWHLPYSYFKRYTLNKGGRSVYCKHLTHTQWMLGKYASNAHKFTETKGIRELRCALSTPSAVHSSVLVNSDKRLSQDGRYRSVVFTQLHGPKAPPMANVEQSTWGPWRWSWDKSAAAHHHIVITFPPRTCDRYK